VLSSDLTRELLSQGFLLRAMQVDTLRTRDRVCLHIPTQVLASLAAFMCAICAQCLLAWAGLQCCSVCLDTELCQCSRQALFVCCFICIQKCRPHRSCVSPVRDSLPPCSIVPPTCCCYLAAAVALMGCWMCMTDRSFMAMKVG
jgi:hypothetical protein